MLSKIFKSLIIGLLFGLLAMPLSAATIYFAPTAQGAGNGTSAANAYAWTDATHGITGASASWVAGNTLYVVAGTYPCSAVGGNGSNGITAKGGGSSGSPITLQFDTTGAVNMTCPYWGNAINLSGYPYLIADGATSAGGVIQNTANGSILANQQQSTGIESTAPCLHQEIRNFTIQNIYVYSAGSSDSSSAHGSADIATVGCDSLSVHGNTLNWAKTGFFLQYTTLTSLNVYNNAIDYTIWSMYIDDTNSSSTTAGANIYGNLIGPHFSVWDDPSFLQHQDGIFLFAGFSTRTGFSVYTNQISGDMDAYGTGYITLAGNGSGDTIFNNVFKQTVDQCLGANNCGPQGHISAGQTGGYTAANLSVYNNTFLGDYTLGDPDSRPLCAIWLDGATWSGTNTVENNIYSNFPNAYCTNLSSLVLQTSNGNDFYNIAHPMVENYDATQTLYSSLTAWQAATLPTSGTHPDLGSSTGNPNVTSSAPYFITSGSAASGLGINLTSLSIAPLNSDAPYTFGPSYACGSGCTARPSSGAWPAGAYQLFSSLNPPTGVASSNGGSVGAHTVTITWNPPTGTGLTYYVFRGFSAGGGTPIASGIALNCTGPSGGCTYTDSTVVAGMSLYYFVEAYNGSGYSSPSNIVNDQVPVTAPTGLTVVTTN